MSNWDDVTYEELARLYIERDMNDSEIATMYNVTKGKVAYSEENMD